MWDGLFGAANLLALLMWLVLIAVPRVPLVLTAVMYGGVGLLCAAYTALMLSVLSGFVDPLPLSEAGGGGFSSIADVRALFMSDGGVTIGWIHYLAFDLFAGLWIARDADSKGFSRWLQAAHSGRHISGWTAGPVHLAHPARTRARRASGAMQSALRK